MPYKNETILSETTCRPNLSQYKWVTDVPMKYNSSNGEKWKLSIYTGPAKYEEMQRVCSRIVSGPAYPYMAFGNNTIRPSSGEEEDAIDQIVKRYKNVIFNYTKEEEQGLLWTGYSFWWNKEKNKWENSLNSLIRNKQYCYQNDWKSDLGSFQKSLFKFILVAKDYRGRDEDSACWQLLPMISKDGDIDKEEEISPVKLPFVCKSKQSDPSGKSGLPGSSWKVTSRTSKFNKLEYLFSPFRATYSEAVEECKSQNAYLVTIESKEKLNDVNYWIGNTTESRSSPSPLETQRIWTGGYFNLLSDNPYQLSWVGGKNFTDPILLFGKDEWTYKFKRKIEKGLKKSQDLTAVQECSPRRYMHVYWNQEMTKNQYNPTLNVDDDVFKPDTIECYIMCERKKIA